MSEPLFPRQFRFERPLFKNENGPQSPWLNVVDKLKFPEQSRRQALTTYHLLRRFRETQLAKHQQQRGELIARGQQGTAEYAELLQTIERKEKAFRSR